MRQRRRASTTLAPVPPALLAALEGAAPAAVKARASDRLAYAHDASHVLLIPTAVVAPRHAGEVASVFRAAAALGVSLTFRSGGTSLSGQAVTDHVLVDTRRWFREVEVLDDGARVRVQPGATLRGVNTRLAPYGRRLGPDPASDIACTMGGVIANNSSGMTCGTERNAYRTLDSLEVVLPSGSIIDTGAPGSDDRFRSLEPVLHGGLASLRDRVRQDEALVARIRAQFAIKNTMGYGINALLDHDAPAAILAHLLVGSEGTLGFVARAVLRTVVAAPFAATGLLVFADLAAAMAALPELIEAGPAAVELLDAASLRVAQMDPRADAVLRDLRVGSHAALLVEWQEADAGALEGRVSAANRLIAGLRLVAPGSLTADAAARALIWGIRKGLYAAVAGARPAGTTTLLEDIAVPLPALVDTCRELTELFDRHGYEDAVIFGHARDGNLHFMLTERFVPGEVPHRHARFVEDMAELVLRHGGALKAEHGTGRVMAPFVRRQFGDELYEVMREIKRLCDPEGILNPGVVIGDDADAHLRNLKTSPSIEPEVERCVECGYCEPVCPSSDLTTTPRQRIVLRREGARARAAGDLALSRELEAAADYDVLDTCAADGMCALACPVRIDTADLVKKLRADRHGAAYRAVWRAAASRWDLSTRAVAVALDVAGTMPAVVPAITTRALRRVLDQDVLPAWTPDLPKGGRRRRPAPVSTPDAIFLPSCTQTMFDAAVRGGSVSEAVLALAERAGVRLHVPRSIENLCCGTPWTSKGLSVEVMDELVGTAVEAALAGRQVPLISDAVSCTEGFTHLLERRGVQASVVDAVAYAAEVLLPRLQVHRRIGALAIHPTCSSTRLGLDAPLMTVAHAVADRVVVPDGWGCCGFAGDRGMLHPELTAAATWAEARSVGAEPFDAWASVNRPCEMAMTRATGHPYRHILELLAEATV